MSHTPNGAPMTMMTMTMATTTAMFLPPPQAADSERREQKKAAARAARRSGLDQAMSAPRPFTVGSGERTVRSLPTAVMVLVCYPTVCSMDFRNKNSGVLVVIRGENVFG